MYVICGVPKTMKISKLMYSTQSLEKQYAEMCGSTSCTGSEECNAGKLDIVQHSPLLLYPLTTTHILWGGYFTARPN